MAMQILIAGYYGFNNTGDEAILEAIIHDFQNLSPDTSICVLSGNPVNTTELHHVDSIPWENIPLLIERVSSCDLVIIGGGGLFHDYWGVDRSTLLTAKGIGLSFYTSIAVLAAICHKPLALYALGVGPLFTPEGKACTKAIADYAVSISVRDKRSREILLDLGIPGEKIKVTTDAAFTLRDTFPPSHSDNNIRPSPTVIGVALRNWNVGVDPGYWENEVAASLDDFLEHHTEAHIEFIPFQNVEEEFLDDTGISRQILSKMVHHDQARVADQAKNVLENYAKIAACDLVLGMRLHSLIFAVNNNIPVIGLIYDPKVKNLFQEIGLEDYMIDIHSLDRRELTRILEHSCSNYVPLSKMIEQKGVLLAQTARSNSRVLQEVLTNFPQQMDPPDSLREQMDDILLSLAYENDSQLKKITNLETVISYQKEEVACQREQLAEAFSTQKMQQAENEKQKAAIQSLNNKIEEYSNKVLEVQNTAADYQKEIENLSEQLISIKHSRAWKLILGLWGIRSFFIPNGSKREAFFLRALHFLDHPQSLSNHVQRKFGSSKYGYKFFQYRKSRKQKFVVTLKNMELPFQPGLVSLVLPVYNGEKYICEAIDSILAQSYPNFELIIVNDGSTDRTLELVNEYSARDVRIRIFSQKNGKLPKALNTGMATVHGEFVTWTSDDNRLKPDFLKKMVACLQTHPDWDMVYANMDLIGEDGEPLRGSDWYSGYQSPPGSEHIHLPHDASELNTWPNNFIGGAFLYRNAVNKILPGYSPYQFTREDYDYWMQINSLFTLRHVDFKDPVYEYRFHSRSLTNRDVEMGITEDRKYLMVFDDFRRDFYLLSLYFFIDDHAVQEKDQGKVKKLIEKLSDRGNILLSREDFTSNIRSNQWLPVVYLEICSMSTPPGEYLENLPKDIFKINLCLSTPSETDPNNGAWDFRAAWTEKVHDLQSPQPLVDWFFSPDLDSILTTIDVFTKTRRLRTFEQEIFDPASSSLDMSLIICTLDRPLALENAIRSIASQTISQEKYEVLIIDNNPQGNSSAALIEQLRTELFASAPKHLRLIHCPIPGLSIARNTGLAEARGRILFFMDDDAVANRDVLEQYVRAFDDHPEAGVIGGHIRVHLPDKLTMPWCAGWERYWSQFITGYSRFTSVEKWWEFPWGANWCASRKALLQIGGFRTVYGRTGRDFNGGEEIVAASLIQKLGYTIAVLPQAEVLHQVEPSRFSLSDMKKTIRAGIFVHYQAQKDLFLPYESSAKNNFVQIRDVFSKAFRFLLHPSDLQNKTRLIESFFHLSAYIHLFFRILSDRLRFSLTRLRNV